MWPKRKIGLLVVVAMTWGTGVATLSGCSGKKSSAEYLAAAQSYQKKGEYDAALIEMKNLLAVDSGNASGRLMFATLLNKKGDGVSAERELLKIAKDMQGTPAYRIELGRALLLQNDAGRVLKEIHAEGFPMDAAATILSMRGGAYLSLRQIDDARSAFAEAIKIQPRHVPSILGLASLAIVTNDMRSAEAYVDNALTIAPNNVDALLFKGDLLRQQGKPENALKTYQRAANADQTQYSPLLRQAILLLSMGKVPEAKETLAKVDKIHPGLSDTRYYSALIHFSEGRLDQAQSLVLEVLKQAPGNAPASLLAGAIADRKGHYSLAESYLEPVVKVFPLHTPARKLLASVQVKAGQTERALATLQTGLKIAPDDVSLLSLAGDASYQAQRFNQANEYYSKARKLSPDSPSLRTRHSMSQLALGQTERAMAELEAVSKVDQTGGQADYLLVMAHLSRQEYDQALSAWAVLEKKQPKTPRTYSLKADILLAKKDRQGAILALEQALVLQPSYLPAVMQLVAFDLQDKKPEMARKRFERLLDKDPKNVDAMTALGLFLLDQAGQRSEGLAWLERAHKAQPSALLPATMLTEQMMRSGDKNKALTYAQQAFAAQPGSVDALYLLARVQLASGQKNQALANYHKLVAMTQNSPLAYFRLAGVQAGMNDVGGAVASLNSAIKLKPDFLDAIMLLISLQAKAGNLTGAMDAAKNAQQNTATAYQGYLLEGDLWVQKKMYAEARGAYQEAMRRNDSAVPAMKIHAAQSLSGDARGAEKTAQSWLLAHPADVQLRKYLAEASIQAGNLQQSAEYYQQILKQNASDAATLNSLAWVYQGLKDPRALVTAEASVKNAPENPLALDTLAMILLQQGEKSRSLALLQKANVIRPDDAEIAMHLAMALLKNNRPDEAKALIEKAKKSKSPFVQRTEFKEFARQLN